jgi:hypothetical protein
VLIEIKCEFVLLQFYIKDSIAIYFTDMDNLSSPYDERSVRFERLCSVTYVHSDNENICIMKPT